MPQVLVSRTIRLTAISTESQSQPDSHTDRQTARQKGTHAHRNTHTRTQTSHTDLCNFVLVGCAQLQELAPRAHRDRDRDGDRDKRQKETQ